MTNDFVEDAADSLEHHERPYLMLAATSLTTTFRCSRIHNVAQLEWMKRRFEDYYKSLRERLEKEEQGT